MGYLNPARSGNGDRTDRRERALERLDGWEKTPHATLAAETEASLCSAFALADLFDGLLGR